MADQAVIDLARRFEPILFFHPGERFFPSDAKRYLERCALWKAEARFDRKTSWGGRLNPLPRQPLIEHTKIAALPGEVRPGAKYLASDPGLPYLTETNKEERFLELAGWKVPVGFGDLPTVVEVFEPGVDQHSHNLYHHRAEVERLYESGGDPVLPGSRYWYHAELFEAPRLREILTPDFPGATFDLDRVFAKLAPSNPALLCYYFFYPAHDEPLAPPCQTDYHGREFAGFGGEWQCFAILLGRTSLAEPYQPRYFGYTGRYHRDSRQGIDVREPRVGMTVSEWTVPQKIEVVDEHPKLYVSRGTHSLYPDPGQHAVEPYRPASYPQICGHFDGPDIFAQHIAASTPDETNVTALVVKLVSGYVLGPIGLGAAIIWGATEKNFGGIGVGTYNPPTHPEPDIGPQADSAGTILRPRGLAVPAAGATLVDWAADENVIIDGRRYDFIVDRGVQRWWPTTNLASGFRGRWGPRVANDPFARRAGMRFPSFWQMFFEALVKHGYVSAGP